jgi:hypothetical protein
MLKKDIFGKKDFFYLATSKGDTTIPLILSICGNFVPSPIKAE